MKFGPIAVSQSEGAILAHAVRARGLDIKKGEVVTQRSIAALKAAGVGEIVCAVLEAGDIGEDEAASIIARRIAGAGIIFEAPFTGRCNLFADAAGLVCVNSAVVDAVNAEDEAITVATLPPMQPVLAGGMVAVVKIIPFAVPSALLNRSLQSVSGAAISVARFQPLRIMVISTLLPGFKNQLVEKTLRTLEVRLAPTGAAIVADKRVAHEPVALAVALDAQIDCDLIVVIGASAISDRRDAVPVGIAQAGGTVLHLGMPADPGSMLLLGETASGVRGSPTPIIGAPGCIRSSKLGSFDLVLHRILAGLPVAGTDLRKMGVGGLIDTSAMTLAEKYAYVRLSGVEQMAETATLASSSRRLMWR